MPHHFHRYRLFRIEDDLRALFQLGAIFRQKADEMAAAEDPEELADIRDTLRAAASAVNDRQMSPEEANAALQRLEQQLLGQQDPSTGELEDALAALAGSLASEAPTRDLGTSLARGDLRQAARETQRLSEDHPHRHEGLGNS